MGYCRRVSLLCTGFIILVTVEGFHHRVRVSLCGFMWKGFITMYGFHYVGYCRRVSLLCTGFIMWVTVEVFHYCAGFIISVTVEGFHYCVRVSLCGFHFRFFYNLEGFRFFNNCRFGLQSFGRPSKCRNPIRKGCHHLVRIGLSFCLYPQCTRRASRSI